ncbi:hypothetical protein GEMRC1_011361 [Eukaryota sp. GEM-RC1]
MIGVLLFSLLLIAISADYRCRGIVPENTNYSNSTLTSVKSWTYSHDRSVWSSPAYISGDLLYFHTNNGIVKLDLATGKLLKRGPNIRSRGAWILNCPSKTNPTLVLFEFPGADSSIHFLSKDLTPIAKTTSVNPFFSLADETGVIFCDQRVLSRVNYDGTTVSRKSLDRCGDVLPAANGYLLSTSSSVIYMHKSFTPIWTQPIQGLRFSASSPKNNLMFTAEYDFNQHDYHFITGWHLVGPSMVFEFKILRLGFYEDILFLSATEDGSVVFGLGSTSSKNNPIRFGFIELAPYGYLEPRFFKTVDKGLFQSHVVFPGSSSKQVVAISFWDQTVPVWETKVVFIDVVSGKELGVFSEENKEGGHMVGFGDLCVAFLTKGQYNVPNTINVKCL